MTARRKGLGRGLGALLQDEPAGLRSLPVEQLEPNRLQPRSTFNESGLAELAESIRAQGVVQPLVVTPSANGKFAIVAGERRWRAAQRAGLTSVPVVVREVKGDQDLLELALVENLQREDLNAVEEAEAYHALQEKFSLSQDQIAQRVGKGRTTVTNSLRLLRLPAAIQDLLRDGQLTAGQARPLLAIAETEAQIRLATRAVREQLTARQLEHLAATPRDRKKKSGPPQEVNTAAAQEKLTRRLQTKVEIRRRGKGGTVRIHFHTEEELMRLYDLLMQRGDEP